MEPSVSYHGCDTTLSDTVSRPSTRLSSHGWRLMCVTVWPGSKCVQYVPPHASLQSSVPDHARLIHRHWSRLSPLRVRANVTPSCPVSEPTASIAATDTSAAG